MVEGYTEGVSFDDKVIQGLIDLERPKTAQQL
jgi:hypothetical protein